MINLKTERILIPVDFSETASLAIKHGAFIAEYLKGEVILAHIIKTSVYLDMLIPMLKVENINSVTTIVQEKLEDLATQIRKDYGVKVSTLVSTGKVPSEIANIAKENKADLIVMGTQGYSAVEELLIGSNAYRVITRSNIPVMTIRKEADKFGYKNILLPIDSSPHSRQKVNATIHFASSFAAKVHILGVLGTDEKNYESKMNVILHQIEELCKDKNVSCSSKIEFVDHRAKQTIAYGKTINADLIVTMTDQDAELSSVMQGSYNHQLVSHSKIPVLSFPPMLSEADFTISVAGLSN